MHRFLDELRAGLRRCHIGDERVVVAVSGGADSVALLRGLVEVAAEFSLELCVAHLNHGLRGSDSDTDASWVGDVARSLDLRCEIGQVPASLSPGNASGVEETARGWRYHFLDATATKLACSTIALAHTADDQAETVLHHILRGTGITGLRGMLAVRSSECGYRLTRPLLSIRRTQVEEYLQERGQPFRTDATNSDTAMTRNRLRHVILPLLREQINPQVDTAICRLAEQAADIDEFLRESINRILERTLKDLQPHACYLDVEELVTYPRHVIRELFREIWQRENWPLQAMGFEQWNRLVDVLDSRTAITLPNRIEARFHSKTLLVLRQL